MTTTTFSKYIVYTIPKEPIQTLTVSTHERRAFWHFQHRTAEQIEGHFRSDFWSVVVPRMVQNDAIVHQAVLALSAFHEHYLDHDSSCLCLSDHAFRWYQNARRQIIELKSPDHFFDSILCACVIFCTCEALVGDFEPATRHALAGMRMIAAWKTSTAHAASMFESAEKTLTNIFLALQMQVMEANMDEFQIQCPGLVGPIEETPDSFNSVDEAFPHLQVLSTRIFDLFQDAETYYETNVWLPSQISPALQPAYDAICAKYGAWTKAISNSEGLMTATDTRSQAGRLLLEILGSSLEINLQVFLHGEVAYDESKEMNYGILNLVEAFLDIHSREARLNTMNNVQDKALPSDGNHSSFTSSPEVVPLLFEITTRTNDTGLRQRALQLLRRSSRREGIWDGHLAASLAEKIVQLKQQGAKEAGNYGADCKFLITDILLLSEQRYLVRYGYKKVRTGSFNSFWLEKIAPGQGLLRSQILTIT